MSVIISIIIPCFNHGAYLYEAIASVEKNVSGRPYELIIVDDGSTDSHTIDVIQNLQNQKYNVIRQTNQGLAAARNNGIALAKGNYIIPLDSDNMLSKGYFTKAFELLERDPSIDVVYGQPIFFDDGDNDGMREEGLREIGEFNFTKMLDCNYIDACAMFRKSIWEKVGGYDGSMPAMGHEDWEIWINIFLSGGKFCHLNEVCFHYRIITGSMLAMDALKKHDLNKQYIYNKYSQGIVSNLLQEIKNLNHSVRSNKVKNFIKSIIKNRIR